MVTIPSFTSGSKRQGPFGFEYGTDWFLEDGFIHKLEWQSDTNFTIQKFEFNAEFGSPVII